MLPRVASVGAPPARRAGTSHVTSVFGAEDGWGKPTPGPASGINTGELQDRSPGRLVPADKLAPWSTHTHLQSAAGPEWFAGEISEPVDEIKAGGRQQQRQLLRKDASQDHRHNPRILSLRRRN